MVEVPDVYDAEEKQIGCTPPAISDMHRGDGADALLPTFTYRPNLTIAMSSHVNRVIHTKGIHSASEAVWSILLVNGNLRATAWHRAFYDGQGETPFLVDRLILHLLIRDGAEVMAIVGSPAPRNPNPAEVEAVTALPSHCKSAGTHETRGLPIE